MTRNARYATRLVTRLRTAALRQTACLEDIDFRHPRGLDDFGIAVMTDEQRRDLLEILEDRYERRSTLVTSQFPVDRWHELMGDPTLADAILDRLVHNAYRVQLKGESMRKRQRRLTDDEGDNT